MPDDERTRAAIAVASPDLLAALSRVPVGDREVRRVRAKLWRYRARMATRATPYGLFAGVGLVRWGPVTDLRLSGEEPRTRTRPDMGWLAALVAELESEVEVRRRLQLIANPAAIIRAGRVLLAAQNGVSRAEEAVSLRATEAVRLALKLSRRPVDYHQLASALLAVPGATQGKVEGLIEELWRHDVLISDARPPLTCESPARYLCERLDGVASAGPLNRDLNRLLVTLERWDALPLSERSHAWPTLVQSVRAVHPFADSTTPVQVDMALPLAGARVQRMVADDAALAAELLLRISPYPTGPPSLEGYGRSFVERYGLGRSVPLLELLDPHFGLGPPVGYGSSSALLAPARHPAREQALLDLALIALRERLPIVELDDETLARLQTWSPVLAAAPPSLDLSVSVAAASVEAVDAGDYRVVVGPMVGALGAGRSTGRFAELLGSDAFDALEETARAEADRSPGSLLVEIVYAPLNARAANIAVRPVVYPNEITFGMAPGVAWERVVPLDQLFVSVRDGRLRVSWPERDVDVVAVQGHVLNAEQAPAVARFLLEVAMDRRAVLCPFDWGPASSFPFLPRVERGRLVLALAQWLVRRSSGPGELSPEPAASFPDRLARWRASWSVPRYVCIAELDNRLMLDLESPVAAEQLRAELGRIPSDQVLRLQEALPGPDEMWLSGPAGHHAVELVVPVVVRRRPDGGAPAPVDATRPPVRSRLRTPGTDWLYLKLYCPSPLHDDVIAGPLRTLAGGATAARLADAWFFLRYADPDPHLRIRFHLDPKTVPGELFDEVCRWANELVVAGACLRFGFGTYEREIERYGGERGMLLSEAIFAADSVAVADLLALDRGHALTNDRLSLAVMTIDDLLAALGFAEEERFAWSRARADITSEDGREFRKRETELRLLLSGPDPGQDRLSHTVRQILDRRRTALRPTIAELDMLENEGRLQRSQDALSGVFIHLHCNRLLAGGASLEHQALSLLRRTRAAIRAHR